MLRRSNLFSCLGLVEELLTGALILVFLVLLGLCSVLVVVVACVDGSVLAVVACVEVERHQFLHHPKDFVPLACVS